MKGNNSTKARHQDLEGTNLLDQQLSRVQIFGLEVITFLLFPWTIGNSKLLPFLFIILILCWKVRLTSQGSQSLKIGLSLVIFENFIWQSLSKFYFSKLGLWFYNGHERGFFFSISSLERSHSTPCPQSLNLFLDFFCFLKIKVL